LAGCIVFKVVRRMFGFEEAAVLIFLWRHRHGLVGEFTEADGPLRVEVIVESTLKMIRNQSSLGVRLAIRLLVRFLCPFEGHRMQSWLRSLTSTPCSSNYCLSEISALLL
jgi:hypothetical protein